MLRQSIRKWLVLVETGHVYRGIRLVLRVECDFWPPSTALRSGFDGSTMCETDTCHNRLLVSGHSFIFATFLRVGENQSEVRFLIDGGLIVSCSHAGRQ